MYIYYLLSVSLEKSQNLTQRHLSISLIDEVVSLLNSDGLSLNQNLQQSIDQIDLVLKLEVRISIIDLSL
jgi:hypothetical protein